MKSIKSIIPYIFSISLIYFLFVFSFYAILYFDKNFLLNLFDKFKVYENLPFNLNIEDANKIATELMDYLRGASNFLETVININGESKELYSLTAKIHMADVRNIFMINIRCHYFSLSIAILCLLFCIRHNIGIEQLFKAYKNTLLVLSIFIIIILVYASIDFNSFFMDFHKIIFTNDYYLFNPSIDYIILMLPENLFHYTRMSVIIMVLSKKKNDKRILFIDASDEYKSGKRNNILTRENQNKIRGTYKRKIEVENYSHLASFVEITNNNYILTIKKYVQKKLIRKKIDRNELIQKVKKLEKERNILEENINDVLETLNYKEIIELQRVEKKDTDYVVDYQQIGNRIIEKRRKMNITQEMLAEKLSISLKYISRIEMGIGTVNLVTLVKICKILDMDLDELLSNE